MKPWKLIQKIIIASGLQGQSKMALKIETAYSSILALRFENFFDSHPYNYIGNLKMDKVEQVWHWW